MSANVKINTRSIVWNLLIDIAICTVTWFTFLHSLTVWAKLDLFTMTDRNDCLFGALALSLAFRLNFTTALKIAAISMGAAYLVTGLIN